MPSDNAISVDVLLVGAGPIGIELAVGLKGAGFDYAQLDASQIGSTISWYAPQTQFFSSPERIAIAGVPLQTLDQSKATREEYLTYLRSVILQFALEIRTFERVISIAPRSEGGFDVVSRTVAGERRWRAMRLILAIGGMHRPRLLGVPGEGLPHVSHYFADPHTWFRRQLLIVGGKNSAVEAAIRCVRVGADVTLSYRRMDFDPDRVKFWLLPEIRALVRDGRLRFLPGTVVTEIRRGSVLLARNGETLEINADSVLLLTGYEQDSTLFRQAGVTLEGEEQRPQFDSRTMETNVPGLYVAGTATAGTQLGGVKEFIETSHVHVARILAALRGLPPPEGGQAEYTLPEA